jgi:uncharacterized protein
MWRSYVLDSLIETVVARDVLQMQTVTKPALLRQLLGLCAQFPAEILSYNKMLGHLYDAGNTTTLAHYITLLETAFLISGVQQFSRDTRRTRASSPKLILWNNALVMRSCICAPMLVCSVFASCLRSTNPSQGTAYRIRVAMTQGTATCG